MKKKGRSRKGAGVVGGGEGVPSPSSYKTRYMFVSCRVTSPKKSFPANFFTTGVPTGNFLLINPVNVRRYLVVIYVDMLIN